MEAAPPPDATPSSYKLPVTAFWLSLLGCIVCPIPLALVMGLVALAEIRKNPNLPNRRYAIAAIVISVLWAGFVYFRLVPNYVNFGARARAAECHSTLKSMYQAQKSYYAERKRYPERLTEVGINVESSNRYAYFLSPRGPFEDRSPGHTERPADATGVLPERPRVGRVSDSNDWIDATTLVRAIPSALAGNVQVGVSGTCPDCDITMVCVGDIDGDDGLDVWSVSTKDRQDPDGEKIPAGEPYQEIDDLKSRGWGLSP